jgi:hypothetical protein
MRPSFVSPIFSRVCVSGRPRWVRKTSSRDSSSLTVPPAARASSGGDHLEVQRLDAVAEAAADEGLDDADRGAVQPQRLRQRQVQVVGHLGHRVHGQRLALRVPLRQRRVELHLAVRDLGAVVFALEHQVGGGEAGLDVAEVVLDPALDVARLVVVQQRGAFGARGVGVEERRQRIEVDLDRAQRGLGGVDVVGRDREQRLAAVAHAIARQRPFVLRDRDHAVGGGEVPAGDHGAHAGQRQRARRIDAADHAVRDHAAADAAHEGAGAGQVGGVARTAADLLDAVDERAALADRMRGGCRFVRQADVLEAHGRASSRVSAAACTDSMILV